jgi:hypothetical protein
MITIANPSYDAVFKSMMEDLAAAQCLLGGLLGEEVEILELLPQERTLSMPGTIGVRIMRFDYRATLRYKVRVKNPDEFKNDPFIQPLLTRLERIIADPEVARLAEEEDQFESHYLKSLERSKAEGEAIGEMKAKRETARQMKADGLSIAKIAAYTGLSESEIDVL